MRLLTLLIVLLFYHAVAFGQVATQFIRDKNVKTRLNVTDSKKPPQFKPAEKIDLQALQDEDKAEEHLGLPFRFGKALKADLGLQNGQWTETPEGRVWQLQISSPGAYSLNLQFDRFRLAEGAELMIYNSEKTFQMGPVTSKENNSFEVYATDIIKGSSIIVELFEPNDVKTSSKLHISKLIHAYKNMFPEQQAGGYGTSNGCNININCSAGSAYQNVSNAVAMILLATGDRICTGCLVNNTCQDFTPYILTAFHCLDTGGGPCAADFENGTLSQDENQ